MAETTALSSRERMIRSTALLIRERGARATSIGAVLEHSGAPRGSVYHHFPGGREQLLQEATDFAGRYIAGRLEQGSDVRPLGAIDSLFEEYRQDLVDSDFRAGCPIVAVAVEADQGGPDLHEHVLGAFDRSRRVLVRQLCDAGVDAERADQLAMLLISGLEGALVLSRAYRDPAPLERMHAELREGVQAEIADANQRRVDR